MKRFPIGLMRTLLVAIILLGSIVTFNFGLEKGLNPRLYPPSYSDLGSYTNGPNPADTSMELNTTMTFIVLAIGVLILAQNVAGSDRRRRNRVEPYMPTPWTIPSPHWITSIPAKQKSAGTIKIRPTTRVNL
jgi:hypothetical protein